MAWRCRAWLGGAWRGASMLLWAGLGLVSSDGLWFGSTPNAALSWQVLAGQGMAVRGQSRFFQQQRIFAGSIPAAALSGRGMSRRGGARPGMARRGVAWNFYSEET